MQPLQIKNLTLGDGIPKICVPIVARDRQQLKTALNDLSGVPFDLAEFRADHYAPLQELCLFAAHGRSGSLSRALVEVLALIRQTVSDKPLLFTIRTKAEGGKAALSYGEYETMLQSAAQTGYVDLIDVELFTAGRNAAGLTEKLQSLQTKVIGSSHDFEKTPTEEKMLECLLTMQSAGMDVTKLAVMPRSRKDVLSLLRVSCAMADGKADRPFVTISMGDLGMTSRICGSLTGSAITFASAGRSSAPGQIDAAGMRQILDILQVH